MAWGSSDRGLADVSTARALAGHAAALAARSDTPHRQANALYGRGLLDHDADRLLDAAERPFRSPGLRAPWYPALGNHDVLVQGETPPTAQLDAIATDARMVVALPRGAEFLDRDAANIANWFLARGLDRQDALNRQDGLDRQDGPGPAAPAPADLAALLRRAARLGS